MMLSIVHSEMDLSYPHPQKSPRSSLMLDLDETGTSVEEIDFSTLDTLAGTHSIVSLGDNDWHFRLHSYLVHYDGRYWCMWSHGPVVEDKPTQHVRYATSRDGIKWSKPKILVGPSSREGFRYIARGFWVRGDGRLRALASHDEALKDGRTHFFGKSLQLFSFVWKPERKSWEREAVVYDNTINNFPPKKLPTGEWMMTRRDSDRNVSFLIGGIAAVDDWAVADFSGYRLESGSRVSEPDWDVLPDGNILGLIRDNSGRRNPEARRMLKTFSLDSGKNWSAPVRTNFPNAVSKFNLLKLSNGNFVLINNANPERRNPLCLSLSRDGLVFTEILKLPIPETVESDTWEVNPRSSLAKYESLQYPHVIEHDGSLLITYSRKKQTVEVVKVLLEEMEDLME